jgi:hypothetical protein
MSATCTTSSRPFGSYTPAASPPPEPSGARGSHASRDGAAIPPLFHLLAGAWVAAALAFAALQPDVAFLLGEDGLVEWWTVTLYGAAGATLLRRSVRDRRVFDVLVALFCVFVAGEEFSWGQRLIGYNPPAFFLERNLQQEATLHNMVSAREILSYALAGFGLLLPALRRVPRTRRVIEAVGASVPPAALAPWFVAAVVLIQWDPTRITGEWAECLSGALFLAATWRDGQRARRWAVPAATLAGAALLTAASVHEGTSPDHVACARAELSALLADVTTGGAATGQAVRQGIPPSRRIWSSVADGDIDLTHARRFAAAACEGSAAAGAAERRRFAVDPWGTGYYVAVQRTASGRVEALVHSYGPNRRRDSRARPDAGDDIAMRGVIEVGSRR